MKLQRQLSNGAWVNASDTFIDKAADAEQWIARNEGRQPRTADEIKVALTAGETVKYDGDWYAMIRDAEALAPTPAPHGIASTYERTLDCGHTVYKKSEVMTTSSGTSCHRCYDRMSS